MAGGVEHGDTPAGEADRDVAIKYASSDASWNNAMKNFTGQLEGFARIDALNVKRAQEQAVLDWLRGQGCNAYQGFLRFPPLPPGRFVEEVLSA